VLKQNQIFTELLNLFLKGRIGNKRL